MFAIVNNHSGVCLYVVFISLKINTYWGHTMHWDTLIAIIRIQVQEELESPMADEIRKYRINVADKAHKLKIYLFLLKMFTQPTESLNYFTCNTVTVTAWKWIAMWKSPLRPVLRNRRIPLAHLIKEDLSSHMLSAIVLCAQMKCWPLLNVCLTSCKRRWRKSLKM